MFFVMAAETNDDANDMAAETSGDAKVQVAHGLVCYWFKNPLIRNVRARFYDMAAETSGDAKGPVAHWTCLLLVKKIHQ